MATNETHPDERTGRQTTFEGAFHADQTRLDVGTDECGDCHELPDDYPCADCYIGGRRDWPN